MQPMFDFTDQQALAAPLMAPGGSAEGARASVGPHCAWGSEPAMVMVNSLKRGWGEAPAPDTVKRTRAEGPTMTADCGAGHCGASSEPSQSAHPLNKVGSAASDSDGDDSLQKFLESLLEKP